MDFARALWLSCNKFQSARGICARFYRRIAPISDTSATAAAREQGVDVRFGDHPEEGDRAEVVAIVFAIASVGYAAVALYDHRMKLPAWSGYAAYGVALIPAIAALILMIVAGHSGATLVWKDVGSFAAGA